MNSPYMSGGGAASFAPPPGLAAMLQQRADQNQKDADNIGSSLGQVGAGVVGAVQGGADPSTFGGDTSAGSGAFQGFMQNFRNAAPGGGGGGGVSSFANMVGGGGAPGGMNVNQLKLAGKTADAFRDQMASHTSSTGDDDPKVLGATDDEWDTMGASQKWAKVQGFVQGQAQTAVMQKIADSAAQANERNAQAKAMGDTGTFLHNYFSTPGKGTGSNDANGGESGDQPDTGTPPSPMERFAYAASKMPANWDVARSMGPIMGSLQKFAALGDASGDDVTFKEDPETGARLARLGKQLIPTGTNPDKIGTPQLQEAVDADGNGTGIMGFVDRKTGKFNVAKQTPTGEPGEGPAVSKDGKFYYDTHAATWKPIHEDPADALDKVMQKYSTGDSSATAPAAGQPLTMTDPKGNVVKVPADQVKAMKKKGYK